MAKHLVSEKESEESTRKFEATHKSAPSKFFKNWLPSLLMIPLFFIVSLAYYTIYTVYMERDASGTHAIQKQCTAYDAENSNCISSETVYVTVAQALQNDYIEVSSGTIVLGFIWLVYANGKIKDYREYHNQKSNR